jgi:hypothetical protein
MPVKHAIDDTLVQVDSVKLAMSNYIEEAKSELQHPPVSPTLAVAYAHRIDAEGLKQGGI